MIMVLQSCFRRCVNGRAHTAAYLRQPLHTAGRNTSAHCYQPTHIHSRAFSGNAPAPTQAYHGLTFPPSRLPSSQPCQRIVPHMHTVAARLLCVARAKGKQSAQSKGKNQDQVPVDLEAELLEDGEALDENEESDFDFDVDELDLSDDSLSPQLQPGSTLWGSQALQTATGVLDGPAFETIELYSFTVNEPRMKIDIRLDDLDDYYGSPSLDIIENFSRLFYNSLEAALGAERAGEIDFEVSTPGAERQLKLPEDLTRFQELPMKVVFLSDDGKQDTKVLELDAVDEEKAAVVWRLADVKANSPGKGRKLSKKMREQQFEMPMSSIQKANLFVDY